MSDFYYFYNQVDKNNNHEVHKESCEYLPSPLNRTFIGYESDCRSALRRAKRDNPGKTFDGCYWCSRACHTG